MDFNLTKNIPDGRETKTPQPPPPPPLPSSQPKNHHKSISNGTLKRHRLNHHNPPPPQSVVELTYKECLKNHAASMGGHALDGCGEFMPSPAANPTDPSSLKCAACGCHRNFHRREPDELATYFHHLQLPQPLRCSASPTSPPSPPPQPQPSSYYSAPHMLLALRTGSSGPLDDDGHDHDHHHHHHHHRHPNGNQTALVMKREKTGSGRKRVRTKFSQEQKEKMYRFSEKLGWKMGKSEEGLVEEFCNEVGVGKGVLKVWMHNNKHTFGKIKNITTTSNHSNGHNNDNDNNGDSTTSLSFDTINGTTDHNINNSNNNNIHHHNNEVGNNVHNFHVSANGGSSSSS